MQTLFSHVDLRVRDGERALVFYDILMAELGLHRVENPAFGESEPVWRSRGWEANDEFFSFVVDAGSSANQNRIAFRASSRAQVDRVTIAIRSAGAPDVDGPTDFGNGAYYATFFEDPDGNKLEVCFLTKHGGLESDPDVS